MRKKIKMVEEANIVHPKLNFGEKKKNRSLKTKREK